VTGNFELPVTKHKTMGQRYYHLWGEVTAFENLLLAFRKARRGKRDKPAVAAFEFDLEANVLALQTELRDGSYRPGPYASFAIQTPKRRLISAAPFRDRVVHHALMNVIGPLFERQFIFDTYANRVGKGTHAALDRCTEYLRRFAYVLPMDVRQFFPAVDHAILLDILGRTLADVQVMKLVTRIVAGGAGVQAAEYEMIYFPGDDLFAVNRPRGLPIGNLTSQFWANVYLNGLDHFVKRELKCRGYVRYVDDLLLFADDKATLHIWRKEVMARLAELRLTVHENSAQPRPCRIGLPFLGFQVFADHRRLKRRNVVQARRRLRALRHAYRLGQIGPRQARVRVQSWLSHAAHADTWGLRRAVLRDFKLTKGTDGSQKRHVADLR
jgi:retron-type reverse transcriptase